MYSSVFSNELLFCVGVQGPFPEMSWVNSSPVWTTSLVYKCQRSGCLDPSSPEIPSTPEESLETVLNLIVFSITLPIMV